MRSLISPELRRTELARTLAGFRPEFGWVVALSVIANVLLIAPSLYMLQVFDRVLISRSEMTLLVLSLLALFLYAVIAWVERLRSRLIIQSGVRMDGQLGRRVFGAVFDDQLKNPDPNPGQYFSDLTNLRQWLTGNGLFAFLDAPWTPVYVLVMFFLHPALGMLALVFIGNLLALARLTDRLTTRLGKGVADEERELNRFMYTKMRNAEVIEAHGMAANFEHKWLEQQRAFEQTRLQSGSLEYGLSSLSKTVRYLQQSLVLGAGAILVMNGEMSVGSMVAANVLMTRTLQPIDTIVAGWKGFASVREAFFRLTRLLEENPPRVASVTTDAIRGEVELREVRVAVSGRARPILDGISLRFVPGNIYVITGPSGSGKSTLAKALFGVFPGQQGEVLLDGLPIQAYDRDRIGTQLGYLPQDIQLFNGTVAENIARQGEVDSARVIDAARTVGIHERLLRLPKGYDTEIGAVQGFLSRGERQRLALARTVYGHPRLVVLDEPDAHLDHLGLAALDAVLRELQLKGSTVLLITHQIRPLGLPHHVVQLSEGRVTGFGEAGRPPIEPATITPTLGVAHA